MPKKSKKSKSKRITLKAKHKVLRKVKEHHRKKRKEARKDGKSGRSKVEKDPGIPNEWPFKEQELKALEVRRAMAIKELEDKKEARKERARKRKLGIPDDEDMPNENDAAEETAALAVPKTNDHSERAFYKELVKVIEASDVILEVLDARDPLGTRCVDMEKMVRKADPTKRIVLLLNKIDLVPKESVEKWLSYLREELPTVAFKCNTQEQRTKLGWKSSKLDKTSNIPQSSDCLGAENLIKLLKNYSRSHELKLAITVGIVGLPNVGKSSLINSLKRSRVVNVGSTPGVTRSMQEVQLDKKVKLLDCPGVVMLRSASSGVSVALRNCKRVEKMEDVITPVKEILGLCPQQKLLSLYKVPSFTSVDDFLQKLATLRGKLKKGGIVDVEAAAKIVIHDWNEGKVPYFTLPPKRDAVEDTNAVIITEDGSEFNVDEIYKAESSYISGLKSLEDFSHVEIPSNAPAEIDEAMLEDPPTQSAPVKNESMSDVNDREGSKVVAAGGTQHDKLYTAEGILDPRKKKAAPLRPLLRQQPPARPPAVDILQEVRPSDPPQASAMASPALISDTDQWKALQAHVGAIHKTHLRDLMADADRCKAMTAEFQGVFLDYARQQATTETIDKLFKLAEAAKLKEKIGKMFKGEKINSTENRSVLHVALRAPRDAVINSDGVNVVPEVWAVKDKIKQFSETFRSGSWVGATGKPLTNVVSVGIGGSFLGPLFVHTALQTDPEAAECAKGRQLRFLANVDPVDVARSIKDLDPATTLVVVVSKTFTTAETMLNARTIKEWIVSSLGPDAVSKHMIAVSTNLKLVKEFGIDPNNAFAFWDWVGGRYSVCSAVGVLPLSLQYGFPIVQKFLEGASSIDNHFHTSSFEKNIPVLLGLLSVWNVSFLSYPARAILPYSQALEKLAPHIQQLSMESNGKGVSIDGVRLPYEAGEIDFGEPGTNGQHSFYQLIHQGRVIPCDFIGVIKSQQPVYLKGETVSNHDELMSNFFAQPDALAYGKTPEQLHSEKVPENLIPHKTFQGNRPSLSFLLSSLSAYEIGQLLSIYEHRIAVQGFIWGINSFDQWGVELGKSLASTVRKQLHASRMEGKPVEGFNPSSASLLTRFLAVKPSTPYDTTVLPKV